jgi:hypothetical protein
MNHHKTLKQVDISHGKEFSYFGGWGTKAGFLNI